MLCRTVFLNYGIMIRGSGIYMKNKLTIIIPFRDTQKYISRNIDSVYSQLASCSGVQALYVDDGSQDESARIVSDKISPKIRLVRNAFGNPYLCRNEAAFKVGSEYIAFIDADTVLSDEWVRKVLHYTEIGDVDWIVGPYLADGRRNPILNLYNSYQASGMKYRFECDALTYFSAYGGNMVVRRQIFEFLGGFGSERRGSDAAFSKKYLRKYGTSRALFDPSLSVTHLEVNTHGRLFKKIRSYRTGSAFHPTEDRNSDLSLSVQCRILYSWASINILRVFVLPVLICMILADYLDRIITNGNLLQLTDFRRNVK